MPQYVIRPLLVGANETDQGIMTYLRGYGQRIYLPIYAFLVTGGDGTVLVDTGLDEYVTPAGFAQACGAEPLDFETALAGCGLEPGDIDLVIQTHLHNDHCENTARCERAQVVVQKAELDFARNPHPLDHRYFPDLLEGLDFRVVEGDAEIMAGLTVVFTPGHTPGGQSVLVETAAGKALITGFCCNEKNFPAQGPAIPPGVHTDAIAAFDSAARVKTLADRIIPCHDLRLLKKRQIPELC